jgi:hypothetical protein
MEQIFFDGRYNLDATYTHDTFAARVSIMHLQGEGLPVTYTTHGRYETSTVHMVHVVRFGRFKTEADCGMF